MAKNSTNEELGPVQANCIYPLSLFQRLTGLKQHAMRQARRRGLRILKCGRHNFVLGSDFIEFLVQENQPVSSEQNN